MSIKDFIKIASVFGEETKNQMQLKEDKVDDALKDLLGIDDQETIDQIKDIADEAPKAKTTGDIELDGSRAALSQVKPDPNDVGKKVEPKPEESGVQGDYAKAAWDKKYGETHNPDGTPKGSSSDETPKAEPTTANTGGASAEERLKQYQAVDIGAMDLNALMKFAREMKADKEVYSMITPELRSQLDAILTVGK